MLAKANMKDPTTEWTNVQRGMSRDQDDKRS